MFPFAANDAVDCIAQFAGLAVILLFTFGGWIISQLNQANKKKARGIAQRQPQRQPQRQGAPPRSPDDSTRQMSAFLQEAAGKKSDGDRSPSVQLLESSPYDSPHDRPYAVQAEIVEAEIADPSTHRPTLEPHLGSGIHSAHGLSRPDAAGDDVHQRFDDDVGRLGDSSDAIHEDPTAGQLPAEAVTVDEIVGIFRSPERVRAAIILNEILTRPDY